MTRTNASDPLQRYNARRDFQRTPEPRGKAASGRKALGFVVQKHWASRLHYDFRLELGGVMKSWAVPKGPSLDPGDKRMAVEVEDHPVAYASFEGTIPPRQYGAGKVIVWDKGIWAPLGDPHGGLRAGNLKFELQGHKLRGRWALVRMKTGDEKKPAWLLIKERDGYARASEEFDVVEAEPDSVASKAMPVPARRARQTTALVPDALPPQALKSTLPAVLSPQLAVRVEAPPAGEQEDWIYEVKFDGYRLLTRIDGDRVQLVTRNGHDWTHRLQPLHRVLRNMHLPPGWYDGEIVVFNEAGLPDFGALQQSMENERTSRVVYYLFDLPYVSDHDLREAPLVARRAVLERLLREMPSDAVRFSEVFEASAASVLTSACRLGLEGVIAKRKDAPYRSTRSADWLKLKCGQRQEFVIGGFTEGKGTRAGFGALLLGLHERDGSLHHVGKVGTGFDASTLVSLHRKLVAIERRTSPFAAEVKIASKTHWVRPSLVAEVAFADWTLRGNIRHAVFIGLREDKAARGVEKEVEVPKPNDSPAPLRKPANPPVPAQQPPAPSSIRVTHPERVIDARSGLTKIDLVRYYESVGPLMIEHLRQRPVALLRAPAGIDGELFFQKHLPATMKMSGVVRLDPLLDPGHDPWVAVSNRRGLMSAAQWNVVEFHTQNAFARGFDKPNRMVFDLDPGEGVAWQQVREAAQLTRSLLDQLGLVGFLKTSGGRGLHVVVPLRRQHGWDAVKGFAQAVVQHMADTIPQRFVSKSGPKNRVGKVFVDYLRNGRGATTVSAWSARARPGLGVSVPLAWNELPDLRGGDHWTLRNVGERIAIGNRPWKDYGRSACSLTAAMKLMGFRP